jgi:hypothetical protein
MLQSYIRTLKRQDFEQKFIFGNSAKNMAGSGFESGNFPRPEPDSDLEIF